jgi:hypothetical protein
MNPRRIKVVSLLLFLSLLLNACVLRPPSGISESERQQTAVIETIAARLTQGAIQTVVAESTAKAPQTSPTLPPDVEAPTIVVATETHVQPTPTVFIPTQTPILPTQTPVLPPTPTRVPTIVIVTVAAPQDWAQLVGEVATPDGTTVSAGQKFTKTWRIKNVGATTWNNTYNLVFSSGNAMGGKNAYPLATTVRPGETIDISVELTAPTTAGNVKGYWLLRNAAGKLFGTGTSADQSFSVSINVSAYKSDVPPASIYPFDFSAAICSARWIHNYSGITLPCTGFDSLKPVWAAINMNPKLEDGRQEDERSIWIHLDGKNGGWVQGIFPEYEVKANDFFTTWVMCANTSKTCDVTFSLDYQIGTEAPRNLAKWEQEYDEKYQVVRFDLSTLAGKKVKLLLGVTNRNGSAADVYWFVPAVRNFPPVVPTAEPTAEPTVAPTEGYPAPTP